MDTMTSGSVRSPLELLAGGGIAAAGAQSAAQRDMGGAGALFGSVLGGLLPQSHTGAMVQVEAQPSGQSDGLLTLLQPALGDDGIPTPINAALMMASVEADDVVSEAGTAALTGEQDDGSRAGETEAASPAGWLAAPLPPVVAAREVTGLQQSSGAVLRQWMPALHAATAADQRVAAMTTENAVEAASTVSAWQPVRSDPAAWQLAVQRAGLQAASGQEGGTAAFDLPDGVLAGVAPSGQAGPGAAARGVTVVAVPQHALQSPDWSDAFSEHLVTLARQGSQTATMQLNPADMGPIRIHLTVSNQSVNVEFATRHADTGDLIESTMPRLAAALEGQGLRLDDVRVSALPRHEGLSLPQQGFTDPRGGQGAGAQTSMAQQQDEGGGAQASRGGAPAADGSDAVADVTQTRVLAGQVDYYA